MSLSRREIDRAVRLLARGGLVAFPTETVYGLGADAEDPAAVARIFAAKGRPAGHPLIVHGAGPEVLERLGREVPPAAHRLAAGLWPGPLTLVVPRSARVPDVVTGGRDTVALRVPAHPVALALCRGLGRGIAAPSANPFGRASPTTAAHVRADLGERVDLVLDGGPCAVGVESTVLDLTTPVPEILRSGAVDAARIAELIGGPVAEVPTGPARAPGMLAAHYRPRARVEVTDEARAAARAGVLLAGRERVAVLSPGPLEGLPPGVIMLPPAGPPEDYARALYAMLHEADRLGAGVLLVVPPPAEGVGIAVRDRLARAASGTPGPGAGDGT